MMVNSVLYSFKCPNLIKNIFGFVNFRHVFLFILNKSPDLHESRDCSSSILIFNDFKIGDCRLAKMLFFINLETGAKHSKLIQTTYFIFIFSGCDM